MTGTGNACGTGSVGALRVASIEGAVRVVILVVPHPDRPFACFFLSMFFLLCSLRLRLSLFLSSLVVGVNLPCTPSWLGKLHLPLSGESSADLYVMPSSQNSTSCSRPCLHLCSSLYLLTFVYTM